MKEIPALRQPLLWLVFIVYALLLILGLQHHELWGDEIHSWNIVKGSHSFGELIRNSRYEGHPPLWYVVLGIASLFSHQVVTLQIVHALLALTAVFLLLFYAPLPAFFKVLVPFGYYFLFEYALLSRNYAAGSLLVFGLCILLKKPGELRILSYYGLLFLLSNSHLLGLLMAGSIHVYVLLDKKEKQKPGRHLILHVLLGLLIALPALYCISPPEDSFLYMSGISDQLTWKLKLSCLWQAPLKAFVPPPAWWNYNFWNTHFLIDARDTVPLLKYFLPLLSVGLLALVYFLLRQSKKARLLFFTNLALTFLACCFFPLTSMRYVGFIFIAFVAASWLAAAEGPFSARQKPGILILLLAQLLAGMFAFAREWQYPFSKDNTVTDLIRNVPAGKPLVTDFSTLNVLSAYTDTSYYCVDMQQSRSFLLWRHSELLPTQVPDSYTKGFHLLFAQHPDTVLYFISSRSPRELQNLQPAFQQSFRIQLLRSEEGAMEKWSNLYLYSVGKP